MKNNYININRLFLVAGYDAQNTADQSLLYLVQSLSKNGDVILFMDSDCNKEQLKKFEKACLFSDATRHGEYDFGSYKRAYLYAKKQNILGNYDFLYLVNDSVYGPLKDITEYLNKMENMQTDAFGLVCNPHPEHPHIQSWFIGCTRKVFLTDWFDKFICSIKRQSDKGTVTKLYEQGFSKLVLDHGLKWNCLYSVSGRKIYNNVKSLYQQGLPFIKKAAFTRHNGELGRQILYVLNRTNKNVSDVILINAKRVYGEKYINWLLTKNPIKIIIRKITYALRKIFVEGI